MEIRHSVYNKFITFIGIVGTFLTFIGISFPKLFPWITFKSEHFLLPRFQPGEVYWEWVYYQLSPFMLKYSSETGSSITSWMYRTNMIVVGVICFLGIGVSIISLLYRKSRITMIGGGIILLSMILFSISLPGVYPSFSWGIGAKYTFYGALIIVTSGIANIMVDINKQNRDMVSKLVDFWDNRVNKKI